MKHSLNKEVVINSAANAVRENAGCLTICAAVFGVVFLILSFGVIVGGDELSAIPRIYMFIVYISLASLCIFFAIRSFIVAKNKKFDEKDFGVVSCFCSDKKMVCDAESDDVSYVLKFENNAVSLNVNKAIFDATATGDSAYLVVYNKDRKPILCFPEAYFELSDDLRSIYFGDYSAYIKIKNT